MVQRVYEQANKCSCFAKVVVATDDERILDHVASFGGEAVMTSTEHQSGTDRCLEVLQKLDGQYDVVINIQGDEPLVNPCQLDLLGFCFNDEETQIATLAVKIKDEETLFNPTKPKVVLDHRSNGIYFSRHTIPHIYKVENKNWLELHTFFKHIGIYGYRSEILREIGKLPPSDLEKAESLEQLRWVENGYKIRVKITEYDSIAVDTPEDLKKVEGILSKKQ